MYVNGYHVCYPTNPLTYYCSVPYVDPQQTEVIKQLLKRIADLEAKLGL